MLCVDCDSPIDEKAGLCSSCGRLAFKPQQEPDFDHIAPYLPGESESDNKPALSSIEKLTGRISPIKIEPIKPKIPITVIISNVLLIIGVIILLLVFYFRG